MIACTNAFNRASYHLLHVLWNEPQNSEEESQLLQNSLPFHLQVKPLYRMSSEHTFKLKCENVLPIQSFHHFTHNGMYVSKMKV